MNNHLIKTLKLVTQCLEDIENNDITDHYDCIKDLEYVIEELKNKSYQDELYI